MDAVRLAIGLVGVLLLVSSVHVAGAAEAPSQPPMFHRAVMGATGGRAKPLSNDYYPAESQTLCFKDSVINNCAVFGCPADSTDTNANRDCWGDVYAESQLTCQQDNHENYDGYNSYGSTFPGAAGHAAINNVASCTWEFHQFTSNLANTAWKILLPDGITQKLGTVKGVCTINHGAEHCGEGFKDGPVCGGSVLTIDAGYYKTTAWWTNNRKTNIANDALLPWQTTTGTTTTTSYYPSCCVLEAVGAIDQGTNVCPDFAAGRIVNKREAGETTPPQAGRRLQEEGVNTANYDHTVPFYQGDATVIWGPFQVANMASGHDKWESTGVMQWVPWVDTTVTQTTTGSPSADAFYVEPGTYRFEFKKGGEYNRY